MAWTRWGEAGLVFAGVFSLGTLLLSATADTEVGAHDLLDEQRPLTQPGKKPKYIEDYTLAGFRDFRAKGRAHPLLVEYRRDLAACGVTADAWMRFEVVVDADGDRSHSLAESPTADTACLEEALALIPFEGLAPPTGTLVASGWARGEDLTVAPDEWRQEDMMRIKIFAKKDGEEWKAPGGKGAYRFLFSEPIYAINDLLDCSTEHDIIWVRAAHMAPGPGLRWVEPDPFFTKTIPSSPCVEAAFREHWEEILDVAFQGQVTDPEIFYITFNVLQNPKVDQ